MHEYISQQLDFVKLRAKQQRYFEQFDPRRRCTVAGILSDFQEMSQAQFNFVNPLPPFPSNLPTPNHLHYHLNDTARTVMAIIASCIAHIKIETC
jgi:hypothetical protein